MDGWMITVALLISALLIPIVARHYWLKAKDQYGTLVLDTRHEYAMRWFWCTCDLDEETLYSIWFVTELEIQKYPGLMGAAGITFLNERHRLQNVLLHLTAEELQTISKWAKQSPIPKFSVNGDSLVRSFL